MTTPAPGWYPDPATPGSLRWWDGQQWTEHYAPGEAAQPHTQASAEPSPVLEAGETNLQASRKKRTRNALLITGAAVVTTVILAGVAFTASGSVIGGVFGLSQSNLNTEVVSTDDSGYAYTEPMLDLDPQSQVTFPVEFDWEAASAEAGGMENWAFELYLDPTLTRFARAWVSQNGPGTPLAVHPFESNTVQGPPGSSDSAAIMPAEHATSGWGLQSEYYLVRKIDSQGNLLETPVVTKLSTKQQFESPVISAAVNPTDGTVELTWDAVAGATSYVIVGSTGIRTDTDEHRYYTLFGTTESTSWSSRDSVSMLTPDDPYPETQNVGLQLFDGESADQISGGNMLDFGDEPSSMSKVVLLGEWWLPMARSFRQ